jgi:pantothenate kinase
MTEGTLLTDYPASWRKKLDALCGEVELDVAGFATRVAIQRPELQRVYLPVLGLLEAQSQSSPQRVVAGLAGIPGSGKSTFAAILRHLATTLIGMDHLAVVALDGWHWNNLIHERKRIRDVDGRMVPLKERKGCTESFNAPVYAEYLRRLNDPQATLSIPVYDRTLHEPVPDAMTVTPASRLILAEGNYLVSQARPWDEVFEAIGPRFYLACDPEVAKDRVIARHVRGGCSLDQARDRIDRNDEHNMRFVLATASHAEYEIAFSPAPRVRYLL